MTLASFVIAPLFEHIVPRLHSADALLSFLFVQVFAFAVAWHVA